MRSQAVRNAREHCSNLTVALGVSAFMLVGGTVAVAQTPASAPPAAHAMAAPADQSKQLAAQVADLRAQVAKLQAAVKQAGGGKKILANPAMPMGTTGNKPMGMMDDNNDVGMPAGTGSMTTGAAPMAMKDDSGEMGAMAPAGAAPAAAMGMCCMGAMSPPRNPAMSARPAAAGGMASMSGPSSAMPGQAGASHLYHVGSTGFFLNHAQHVTLTADQKRGLNRLKEKAMLDRASGQRQIEQAEQELYTLTGADTIDNAKIQAKVTEIEKQRAEQRMTFIRAVGEASNLLTHEQQQALVGTMAAGKK